MHLSLFVVSPIIQNRAGSSERVRVVERGRGGGEGGEWAGHLPETITLLRPAARSSKVIRS